MVQLFLEGSAALGHGCHCGRPCVGGQTVALWSDGCGLQTLAVELTCWARWGKLPDCSEP